MAEAKAAAAVQVDVLPELSPEPKRMFGKERRKAIEFATSPATSPEGAAAQQQQQGGQGDHQDDSESDDGDDIGPVDLTDLLSQKV